MPRYAEPVSAPIRKNAPPAAARPQPRGLGPAQRAAIGHAVQRRAASPAKPAPAPASRTESRGGLPERLRAGIERLSGLFMGDVRVHCNSTEPAKLGALAYTKGADIHLGPGQEQHLPHEAWHVVQQKQGRVPVTTQMKGFGLNLDNGLEHEADVKGEAAARLGGAPDSTAEGPVAPANARRTEAGSSPSSPAQLKLKIQNAKDPKQPFTAYTKDLELLVKPLSKHYEYTSGRLKKWFADALDRSYASVSSAVNAAEAPYRVSVKAIKFAEATGMTSETRGDADAKTINRIDNIIRSGEFQSGLENAMKTHVLDYKGDKDYIKSHIVSRVNAYASETLKAGNCGEFAEVVYWKMMEITKGSWIGRATMWPRGKGGYDHGFDILSDKQFSAGVAPKVDDDAIVLDSWNNYTVTTVKKFLNKENPYSAQLTMNNIMIKRVEKTIGYDILNSKLKSVAKAAIDKFVAKVEPQPKTK